MTERHGVAVLSRYTQDAVNHALARLPVSQREVLVRRYLQRMTITEVATTLGRSRGAVKQLQHRGMRNVDRLVAVTLDQGWAQDHFPTS
jgi:RNA polymerase sigma-70 factor (ECF subfamily)